ncbi:hypothetical protein SAMN05444392_11841 [Seinonella peptonophila]|uniref:Nucleotidyltransferase domain-containing protein n=1 Tax=Seinonella peptonophila TaxID=112248 RepID=A0A1M5B5I3_9BACL|nr:nucleotidyltransferase domain-containing protein [Seinonella peptonophila]SHF37698.1 hypothetical protein SAMN05444392_11841 [Seinonella peptonophila]
MQKEEPKQTATRLVKQRFPHCRVAMLAGSVVRGDATVHSDLDIVIVDDTIPNPYRESLIFKDWMIEFFVHTSKSYVDFFVSDCKRGRPSLPQMCAEGKIIKDDGIATRIKEEANHLLKQGPKSWSIDELNRKRYIITDLLLDLEGSTNRAEDLFIVNSLAAITHEFVLRTNNQWIGGAKWIVRALANYDQELCHEFVQVCEQFYQHGNKQPFITFVDRVLEPYGGRLFDGFSMGKESNED